MQAQTALNHPRLGRPLGTLGLILAAVLALGAVAFLALDSRSSGAPTAADPGAAGRELVETYMSLLARNDVQGLDSFLSDAFLRQGAEGAFYTKADYLKNLPKIGDYKIGDVTARQDGDAIVVRWLFSVTEVIDGRALSTEPAPRLATFVWRDEGWKLVSHANFNVPNAGRTSLAP